MASFEGEVPAKSTSLPLLCGAVVVVNGSSLLSLLVPFVGDVVVVVVVMFGPAKIFYKNKIGINFVLEKFRL